MLESEENIDVLVYNARIEGMNDMAKSISHHWRQPLTILTLSLSYLDFMVENNEIDIEEFRRIYKKCVTTIDKMSSSISIFEEFTAVDNNYYLFYLQDVMDKVKDVTSLDISSFGIFFDIQIDGDLYIRGNRNELTRAIVNIVENSIDAVANNDLDRQISITCTQDSEHLYIKIKNNGQKLSSEVISRIFEPYFTTKHQFEGIGLSMYVTQNIIKRLFLGEILIDNNDEYVEFIIKIPITNN